jgi:polyhydroxyalkanoate synthesis regulator phasin
MREEIRGYVEAGLDMLSPSGARDLARSLLGGEGRERIQKAAQDLLEWSARTGERVAEMIQREVRRQLTAAGVASKDDLDALRKRVRDLEKASSSRTGSPARSTTKRSGATKRSSTAKRSSSRSRSSAESPRSTRSRS